MRFIVLGGLFISLLVCLLLCLSIVRPPGAFAEPPAGDERPRGDVPPKKAPPEEEPEPDRDAGAPDFLPLAIELHEAMLDHKKRPLEDGPGGELRGAWKSHVKSRAARLASRAADLKRSSMWQFDAEGSVALHLKATQWSAAVRRLAGLYTDLGAAAGGYGKIGVSPDRALARWDRSNPAPATTGLTPAGVLLRQVRAEIAAFRLLQKIVPRLLLRELERLIRREQVEIVERVEARRRWREDRARAHAEIRAQVAATRALIQDQQARLTSQLAFVRALTAAMQEAEEKRLRAALREHASDAALLTEAQGLLAKMRTGRTNGLSFQDARTSRWGSIVRQRWLVPRTTLLGLLSKAERAAVGAKKSPPNERESK